MHIAIMNIAYIIIALNVIISLLAFNNRDIISKTIFNPYQIIHRKEWWRLFSSGFIHADFYHLLANMLVLFFFGPTLVEQFSTEYLYGKMGSTIFAIMYISSIAVSSLRTLYKNINNPAYNALGASGAVSSVLFIYILLFPTNLLYLYGIVPIPAILVGIGYLYYSSKMASKGLDNINHDAHFDGAIYGLAFIILSKPKTVVNFLYQILDVIN